MMSKKLSEVISGWIEAEIERRGVDRVLWDMTLMVTDEGPGYLFAMFSPGAVLGTYVHSTMMMKHIAAFTEDDAKSIVGEMIEALDRARSSQLAEAQQQAEAQGLDPAAIAALSGAADG